MPLQLRMVAHCQEHHTFYLFDFLRQNEHYDDVRGRGVGDGWLELSFLCVVWTDEVRTLSSL